MTPPPGRFAVRTFQTIAGLPERYGPLFGAAETRSPFLGLDWFLNFERTVVDPTRSVIVYGVENGRAGERAVAALPMWSYVWDDPPLRVRRLESLGNYYTPFFAPVVADDVRDQTDVWRAFASALRGEARSWDVLYLQPLDPAAPAFDGLVGAFRAEGFIVQTYVCFGNWYLEVAGRSYAEYLGGQPGIVRKQLVYKTRRVERECKVRYEIHTDGLRLDELMDDYERVYRATWKQPEPYPRFIRGLAQTAAANGWLRLGLIYLDEEPAAAQLWLVNRGVASIYKLCYEERFARHSIGTILTSKLLQYAIDVDKVAQVDYLSGDDAYKQTWMSHRRERWGIRVFNPRSLRGFVEGVKYVGGRGGRRVVDAVCRAGSRGTHWIRARMRSRDA